MKSRRKFFSYRMTEVVGMKGYKYKTKSLSQYHNLDSDKPYVPFYVA